MSIQQLWVERKSKPSAVKRELLFKLKGNRKLSHLFLSVEQSSGAKMFMPVAGLGCLPTSELLGREVKKGRKVGGGASGDE